jgi:predicted dehydrogenase
MWDHFLEVVAGRSAPGCTASDGLASLRVALSAIQSADNGQAANVVPPG